MFKEPAKSYDDLVVWQKAHAFVLRVYALSATFPSREVYGLTSQLRRAAASVPSNIAEGFCRRGRAEKARFFNIAEASLAEASYFLRLGEDLGYGSDAALPAAIDEVSRMLSRTSERCASVRRALNALLAPNS